MNKLFSARNITILVCLLVVTACARIEYVVVKYPTTRQVFVDRVYKNKDEFLTNEVIRVRTGTHEFDLGKIYDYEPPFCKIVVQETSRLNPNDECEFYPNNGIK